MFLLLLLFLWNGNDDTKSRERWGKRRNKDDAKSPFP